LRFNHVLLLPEGMGRCGYDVRIINSREDVLPKKQLKGEETMPTTIKVTVGNKQRSYKFQNEEDAAQAESMLNEEQAFNAEAVQAAIAAKAELEEQLKALQAKIAEHDNNLKAAREQIDQLLSMEAAEVAGQEINDQKDAEEAIIDAETDNTDAAGSEPEKEKEEFGNALKACKTMAERRKVTVTRVMNMRGVKVDDWKQEAFDGAFKMLAVNAKAQAKDKGVRRVLNGTLDIKDREAFKAGNATPSGNFDRIRQAIKAKNSRPEDNSKNILTRLLNALEARQ